jgi:putative endonuclease
MRSGRSAAPRKKAKTRAWRIYVLRCRDGSLYCGITNDLPRRLGQHERGKAARYTRGRGPVKLVKSWPAASLSAALKAERAFKRLSRAAKEKKLQKRGKSDGLC